MVRRDPPQRPAALPQAVRDPDLGGDDRGRPPAHLRGLGRVADPQQHRHEAPQGRGVRRPVGPGHRQVG